MSARDRRRRWCSHVVPAGTGKTYIAINVARALVAHGANKLLIVTYTNHALDQILEAILDSGLEEESVLRIGGRWYGWPWAKASNQCMRATSIDASEFDVPTTHVISGIHRAASSCTAVATLCKLRGACICMRCPGKDKCSASVVLQYQSQRLASAPL